MFLEKYIKDIRILCKKNKVKILYVFGSVLTDRFTDRSDIDSIDPLDYADNYFNLKFTSFYLNRELIMPFKVI